MKDAMGRVVEVQTFDSNGASSGATTTTYSEGAGAGSMIGLLSTDPANVTHTNITDALGRLAEVDEGCPGCVTTYTYDVLGDLTNVFQGPQTRSFTYDFRKLLQSATNPESGTINYKYDAAGNLLGKADQRSGDRRL